MAGRSECAAWVRAWAKSAGGDIRDVAGGCDVRLPGGRQVQAVAEEGRLSVWAGPTAAMQTWPPEESLRWQFEGAFVLATTDMHTCALQMRAALPLEGLTAEHCDALLSSLEAYPSDPSLQRSDGVMALTAARQRWESEYGGGIVRRQDGALLLRCRVRGAAQPMEIQAEPIPFGMRLSAELLAAPFVEPECAPILHRYLLRLNAHLVLGGFALMDEGTPSLCVVLPAPVAGNHVGHATGALMAAHQYFGQAVKTMATDPAAAEWWAQFNLSEKGGDIHHGYLH